MNAKARVWTFNLGDLYAGDDITAARRVFDGLATEQKAREKAKQRASRSRNTSPGTKRPKKRTTKRVLAVLFIDCEITEILEG